MALTASTEYDTYQHIILSGALTYPWYQNVGIDVTAHVDDKAGHDGWCVTFTDEDGGLYAINHANILSAIGRCAAKDDKRPQGVSGAASRQARLFLFNRDEVDFDSDTADQIIQVAAFGGVVIYG